jgi:site-specific recombinase XerD
MSSRSSNPLCHLLTSFFHDHLQSVRGASPHTQRAYAHALRLYLVHLADTRRRSVADLRLDDLDVEGVMDFLNHLENRRGNTAATRNCRLAALRAFFRYAASRDPANALRYNRVLALPSKRHAIRPAVYLEPEQVRAIIAQPDRRTLLGLRDHALLLLLYNTGARVSEALGFRLDDLEVTRPPTIRLRGKGGRERLCPLWRETVKALRHLIDAQPTRSDGPVFRNAKGQRLTRDGVAYILRKYTKAAAVTHASLRRQRVTPHVFRHSCAVALLQAGVDLVVIRDYLGHASVATTSRYVTSNLALKRDALENFWKRAGLGGRSSRRWQPTPEILRFLSSL